MKTFIGIDPGLTGAYAAVCDHGAIVRDIPIYYIQKKPIINFLEMYKSLVNHNYEGCIITCLEQQQAMPRQGVSSTFKTGYNYGGLTVLCKVLTPNNYVVNPKVWKKAFNLIGKDKEASRQLAIELFPNLAEQLKRKKDHNRAEALLLAQWIKEVYGKDS